MKKPARILIVEHSATDADLAKRAIRKTLKRCEFQVVETRRDFLIALDAFQPDVILADYDLPRFDGLKALKMALKHAPLTPVIIWTDCLSEELAVDCTKAGASNYLLKENIRRLGPVIVRALEERQVLLERRQAEAASRESQAKYQDLVETSHDLIWSLDIEGRFTFVNRAVKEIYGYEPEELLGQSFFDILDPQYSLREWGKFREAIRRGKDISDVETYIRHKDGRQLILSTNCIVKRDSEGRVVGLTGSSHEITTRKQIEDVLRQERNLLRTLIDNLPDRIYAMDRQGRKILSNTADWKASGARAMEEVIGKTDFELYAPELAVGYWRLDQSVLESGIPLINHEELGLDEEGNRVSILTSKIPLRDDEGQVTGLVDICRDITPRKEAEMERQVLLEIMQGLANTDDLLALLELIHHAIARVIYAENFFVVLYQPNTGLFEEIYSVDQYDVPEPPTRLEKSITSYVFRSGEPLLLSQARFDELVAGGEVALVGTNSASWLGVPLKTAGTTIGVMAVQDYEHQNRYSERDKEFMASIATQIALAIERKQADEELKKAETKYRTLVERLPVVVYTAELGIDGAWQYISPQIEELLGFTAQEWMADPGLWYRQIHPDDRDRQQALEAQACQRNEALIGEYRIFARNGHQHWIQDSAQILPAEGNGRPIVQGVLMDLTERKQAEEEVYKQSETRIALYETTHDLVIERDLSKLLRVIVERATRLLQASGGGLYLCEPERDQVRCVVSYNTLQDFTGMTLKYGEGAAGVVAQTGEPLIIDEYSTWQGRAKVYDEKMFDAVLSVPIKWQNQVIGVLHALAYDNDRHFNQDDLSLIVSFANHAAIAIQNARLHNGLEQRNRVHVALQEASLPLIGQLDLADALRTILVQAAQLLNTQHGYIYLTRPDEQELELATGMGELAQYIGRRLTRGEGVAGLVWETGKPLIVRDYHTWTGRSAQFDDIAFSAVISVPLTSGSRISGVLGFTSVDSNQIYTENDLELLNHFAQLASIALENARLYTLSQQELAERRRAEEALRESEERFISAFEYAAIGMALLTPGGRWFRVNRALCELTGYSQAELLGKTFQDITHPEDLEGDLHHVDQLLAGEINSYQMEKRYFHKQGHVLWVLLSVSLLRDEEGRPLYFISQIQDISERKRAEAAEREQRALAEALRDTAETLGSTLDYGQVLDHILSAVGRVVPHDAATIMLIEGQFARVVRLQGYASRASEAEIMSLRLPLSEATNVRLMKETKQPVVVYDTHVYPGWQRTQATDWLRSSVGAPISIYGEVIGFICLDAQAPEYFTSVHAERLQAFANQASLAIHNARLLQQAQAEILERKQAENELRVSEERFLQLANNIQEVFWMTDAETDQELYMSPAAEMIWGRSVASLMHEPGAFINSVFLEDRSRVLHALQREKSGEKVEIEYRIVRPNGALRWVWDRAFPIVDESGKVIRIAGISADITERRESELALVKSQNRYRQLFDSSPIPTWEEDFSAVKRQIDLLGAGGVTDLKEYFADNPGKLGELAALVRIMDMNQAALELYQIEQKDALLKGLDQVLSADALSHFQEEILGLLDASKRFLWEGTDRTPSGIPIEVIVTGSIPQGYEEDWSKVIVSISDITERKRSEEGLRRRAEETSALLETSQALTDLDLKVTLETIGNSAKNLFDADGCRIFLMEPNGESLRCVLTLQENFAPFSDLRIRVGEGVTGAVAASGRAEIVNEMENDPRAIQVVGTPDKETEAIMFAPLLERDRTIGVLSIRRVGMGTERYFEPADLELLEAFAAMAASAVSNARLFEETQRRLAELQALYENGLAVGRLLKVDQIGDRVIQTFTRYLRWHHVTIRLKKEDTDELELVSFNLPELSEEERLRTEQHLSTLIHKAGQGLSGWVIQTGIPLRTGNVHAYPQYICTQPGIESGLYMPLKVGERVIGVISVESEVPDAFTEQDERLLATLASQAAIAFENARLYEAVQKELSERKRAEDALRSSEAHYRELADSITDILFELDQDLRYTYWNKASEIFSGVPAEAAIGKSIQELFGASEEQSQRQEIYKRVLKEQQARTFEMEMLLNGQKRALEINAYPSRRGVSVVAKDITDRKRTETIMQKRVELMEYSVHHTLSELMQRTVDEVSEITGSTIGFFHFVDEDENQLGMQTWSTNALRLFSVPVREGAHLPLDQAGVWAEAVRQRRPLIQNDYASLTKKMGLPRGHVPIVREIIIPILRNERVMAVLGIGNKPGDYTPYDLEIAGRLADYAWDITERKQMEVELAEERNQLARRVEERTADLSRANSNLARALRVKDEFLANMSHELRTPLNAILGLSESLGEQIAGPLNEKQQKYITTISESGHHLLALINDILDLAKIEAGQITLDINKMDIHSVCQASLRMVKQLAQKKNQEVSLAIEDGLGLMWADERRLKQMIVNLLGNAVKFTPEQGKIGLEVHGDQDANKITITVWDNGIGIQQHDLARLFQPFVQVDSGLARETTGTGLGLALVAQMARLHGGSVNAFSTPGVGSRFSIVLPWEPALALDSATRMRVTGKFRAIKVDETNQPTILLVEDTKEVIMMIQDYLELAGYRIVTAQDGVDAIVQAKLVHPDLILMDVQMPRMDGLEATRKLRNEPAFKYTPIIALTALAMPDDRERCLAAGMDEYISKPVNLKALVKIIQSCLFSKEQRAQ